MSNSYFMGDLGFRNSYVTRSENITRPLKYNVNFSVPLVPKKKLYFRRGFNNDGMSPENVRKGSNVPTSLFP